MPRVCSLTGRKTSSGYRYTHRGKPKYLGGVGTKVTGKTKRKFRPNIQTVTAVVDGSVRRIKVSAKALRAGLVVKPLKRRYAYRPDASAKPPTEPEVLSDQAMQADPEAETLSSSVAENESD